MFYHLSALSYKKPASFFSFILKVQRYGFTCPVHVKFCSQIETLFQLSRTDISFVQPLLFWLHSARTFCLARPHSVAWTLENNFFVPNSTCTFFYLQLWCCSAQTIAASHWRYLFVFLLGYIDFVFCLPWLCPHADRISWTYFCFGICGSRSDQHRLVLLHCM